MIFVEDYLDFNEDEAQAEYESGFPSLDDFLENEKPEPPVIFRTGSICPSCEGDGLFKRPTPYTVDGRPICFRCKGSGLL